MVCVIPFRKLQRRFKTKQCLCTLFSLFSRFGYNLLRLVLKLYSSPFSPRPPPSLPQPNFSLPLFPVFFSFKNTVAPREIENNDHGRTFWGVNKILYAVGKTVNSFISMHKISTPLRVVCVNGKHLAASRDCLLSMQYNRRVDQT